MIFITGKRFLYIGKKLLTTELLVFLFSEKYLMQNLISVIKIERQIWFEYQSYREVLPFHYSVKDYWPNRLNNANNSVQCCSDMSKTTN